MPLHQRGSFANNASHKKRKQAGVNDERPEQRPRAPERPQQATEQTPEPANAAAAGAPAPAANAKRKHDNSGIRNPVPHLPQGLVLRTMQIGPYDKKAKRRPCVQVIREVETVAYESLKRTQDDHKKSFARPNKVLTQGEYLYAQRYCRRLGLWRTTGARATRTSPPDAPSC